MINKLLFVLLVAFFSITQYVSGQKPVIIMGNFQPDISNTELSVYKPYAGYFNAFYPDIQSETKIEGSKFKLEVSLDKSGFVRLQSKGMPKTFFYAEPGDSMQIAFITESEGVTRTIFSGNNAEANNLLSAKTFFNNSKFSEEIIVSILKTAKSADEAFNMLEQEISKSTIPLQDLIKEGKIKKSCFDAMISETQQNMLSWTNSFLRGYFENDEKIVQLVKINKVEMKKLAQILFDQFDPYNSKNRIATANYGNSYTKATLQENGILPAVKPKTQRWSRYDSQFKMIVNQVSTIEYAPDEVQMYYLGNSLLVATQFKPMSDADFIKGFNTYNSIFPKSPYLPIINTYLEKNSKSLNQVQNKFEFGVYQLGNDNIQLVEKDFIGVDTVKTIQTLIKKYFGGSPVFVDYWATWCAPCVAEFRNEPKLRKFLEENNIKILYVSIDNKRTMANWKKLVERYQLNGYHYLVSKEVNTNLIKWFEGIPRYMLFDSKGEVKNDNLPRPSQGDELYNQIRKLLL